MDRLCIRYRCETPAADDRPWCPEHEPLSAAEQVAFAERVLRRAQAYLDHGLGEPRSCAMCGVKAEFDYRHCSEHLPKCEASTVLRRRCSRTARIASRFCTQHAGRDTVELALELGDPGPCLRCGYQTLMADALCGVCRTSVDVVFNPKHSP
jgi:hypothetical protein